MSRVLAVTEPVILAGITGAVSVATAVLLYVRSRKADEATEKLGVATESAQSITQAFEGLNRVIAGLNEIIATLQAEAVIDESAIQRCGAALQEAQRELNRMYRKFGNGEP